MSRLKQLIHEVHRRSLWHVLAEALVPHLPLVFEADRDAVLAMVREVGDPSLRDDRRFEALFKRYGADP